MAGEATVHIAAREDLLWANPPVAADASITFSAGSHRGYYHFFADPTLRTFTCFDDGATHFVAKGEGEAVAGWDALIVEPKVRMADTAARYFDEGLLRPWLLIPFLQNHRLPARVNRPR
jgi:hypothetical protein